MKAQLDIIEQVSARRRYTVRPISNSNSFPRKQNLVQFSPRILQAELEEEQNRSFTSAAVEAETNADVFPPTPTTNEDE